MRRCEGIVRFADASALAAALAAFAAACGTEPTGPAAGRPVRLAVTVQPVSAAAGSAISPAVTVVVQDSAGNTVIASDASVRLRIVEGTGTPGAHLRGVVNVYAEAGVARFPTVNVDSVGSGYVLAATAAGLAVAETAPFSISVAPAAKLAFVVPPADAVVGHDLVPAVAVAALDSLGNLVPAFAAAVTIKLTANPGRASLTGVTSHAASGGRALFPGLRVGQSGDGYTLAAAAPGVAGATSPPFPVTVPLRAIAVGGTAENWADEHACALTDGGVAYCWGSNDAGQLGNGSSGGSSATPVPITGWSFSDLVNGNMHTCGITSGGTFCWGIGPGDGSNQSSTPMPVSGGSAFRALSAGEWYSCGIASGGAAYCWGHNESGQLGVDPSVAGSWSGIPVRVGGGLAFAAISAGEYHTCGVTTGGAAYCWGDNGYGQLGADTALTGRWRATPVPVSGGITFTAISAGGYHTCGITSGGAARCWGYDGYGQLGADPTLTGQWSASPVPVSGGLTFTAISAGGEHTCGIVPGGAAYCWGQNSGGTLGSGDYVDSSTPRSVRGGLVFATLSSGHETTCGVTTGATAYCWGYLFWAGRSSTVPERIRVF